jgi:hypothetical protein
MSIINRLAKLEAANRPDTGQQLTKAERDARHDAWQQSILPVALMCATWQDLARHLRSLREDHDGVVVSLDEARSESAVLDATARRLFERAHRDLMPPPLAS